MNKRWWVVVIAVSVIALRWHRHDAAEIRFATFNIEDFPKDSHQVARALDEIEALGAGFVAVQEINDPERMRSAARERLGTSWAFIDEGSLEQGRVAFDPHYLGVLFDTRTWTFVSAELHDETRLGGHHKPALEVRLRSREGVVVRVIVVHLKSGTPGRDLRAQQHLALRGIVQRAIESGERVVVLGDFNATELADRADLASLATASGLVWATEPLACSAYWERDDGCPSSRLDHVLAWGPPTTVEATGPCATNGCDWHDRCPIYTEQVSDHCPVVVTIR